ncbi:MAG: allantoinase PuuE [Nitratireductor sp.]
MTHYPRDFTGDARNLHNAGKKVKWPKGAHIAVQFVINYEEGSENNILHGDKASEAFLSEITGAQPWAGQRHWNMETIYEYGARSGFWRLHALFSDLKIPATVYGVATALARAPSQVAAMQDADWEIASHGLKWVEYKDAKKTAEQSDMNKAIALHEQVVGSRPTGWYTGRCSMNTVDLIAREGGFKYCSDSYADDLPYWYDAHMPITESKTSKLKPLLVIPYTLDANDMRFSIQAGFDHGEAFFQYLKDTFDTLYEEGKKGEPKMMNIGLHCRLIGRPGRIAALKRLMEYVKSHKKVWFAKRIEIAEHWHKNYPYEDLPLKRHERPSLMSEKAFVENYGGVFEHSSWVAKRALKLERAPSTDSAIGVHNLLCRIFRSATQKERLGVLTAHPDLAGKLATAKRLTKDSTNEQASAGLDQLTDKERKTFTSLNTDYVDKFGFPFIIAVKGLNKNQILKAFKARINNTREEEFETACKQVEKIALLRLKDMLPV